MSVFTLAAQAISSVFVLPVPKPKPPKHSGGNFRMYTSIQGIHVYYAGELHTFATGDELKAWIETL